MKIKLLTCLAALFLALLLVSSAVASATGEEPREIGTMQLLGLLRDAKDQVVVVNFFATNCPPCLEEIPNLIEIRKEYKDEDLELVGLSVDFDRPVLLAFMDKMGFNYPVYLAKMDVAQTFQVQAIPRLLVYDRQGKLVVDHTGFMEPDALRVILDSLLGKQ